MKSSAGRVLFQQKGKGLRMQEGKKVFPLFISLEGKRIFMAGAGKIAARRAGILLSFGAEVIVAAPECSAEMAEILKRERAGNILYQKRCFAEQDLEGADLVLAATNDPDLNHRIAELCKEKKIPVNNASDQRDCSFFFPGVLQEDGLTIGVSSGGSDHKKAAEVCGKLRRFFLDGFQN